MQTHACVFGVTVVYVAVDAIRIAITRSTFIPSIYINEIIIYSIWLNNVHKAYYLRKTILFFSYNIHLCFNISKVRCHFMKF